MKIQKVLDAFALLSYLKGERRAAPVVAFLKLAERGRARALMNEINAGEVFYILARERSFAEAKMFTDEILPQLPIELVSNSFEEVVAAARIKATYAISYADAFAAATGMREQAPVITGDPDFNKVSKPVKIEWI